MTGSVKVEWLPHRITIFKMEDGENKEMFRITASQCLDLKKEFDKNDIIETAAKICEVKEWQVIVCEYEGLPPAV